MKRRAERIRIGSSVALLAVALLALAGCEDKTLKIGGFCNSEADCPPSQACAGGFCVPTCVTSEDCGPGEVCLEQLCLPGCEQQADCDLGPSVTRACRDGACQPTPRPGVLDDGGNQQVEEGARVTLSASNSFAFEPDSTKFSWEQIASNPKGFTVVLEAGKADGVASETVSFTAPEVVTDTTLRFRVTMQDAEGNNVTGEVDVIVLNSINELPTAKIEASATDVAPGVVVTLSAVGSSDPNPNDTLTFEWSYTIAPPPPGVVLGLEDVSEAGDHSVVRFTAPALDVDSDITFSVIVDDGSDTVETTLVVHVLAMEPPTCEPSLCDDHDPCTNDGCIPEVGCTHEANTGGSCDDGDDCTTSDTCDAGLCGGKPMDCDDDNLCTDDYCAEGQCGSTDNGLACDDGDACTSSDKCSSGMCLGEAMSCADGNVCTDDSCVAGDCVSVPNTLPCDDGSSCTTGDSCKGGGCAGKLIDCNDDNPCTNDGCTQGSCAHANNSAPCDDGNPCTEEGTCVEAACKPGGAVSCDDGDPCTADACAPAEGCTHEPLSGVGCDDGDSCTTDDICADGSCAGAPVPCDDENPCTDDACTADGCLSTPNAEPCEDGSLCTEGDACADGVCVAGGAVDCDDGNTCTDDACDPESGFCDYSLANGLPCDDGDLCTEEDLCESGLCAGAPKVCVDEDPCTDDGCSEGLCAFVQNTAPCEDGDPCTLEDHCVGGECAGGPGSPCDDGNPCTVDYCAVEGGVYCQNDPAPMGTPCLDDASLCGDDALCHSFVTSSFLPEFAPPPDASGRLTGISALSNTTLSATGMIVAPGAEGGVTTTGTIHEVTYSGQPLLVHERPEGGLLAVDTDFAVGDNGTISTWSDGVWEPSVYLEETLSTPASIYSVWRGEQGSVVAPSPVYTIGLDGVLDPEGGVGFCYPSGEVGCTHGWYMQAPVRFTRVFGVTELLPDNGGYLVTSPIVGLGELPDGGVQIWYQDLMTDGWSMAPPLGCDSAEPGSPCAGISSWRDGQGTSATDLWALGDNGVLLHFDGKQWTLLPPGGMAGDVAPEALQMRGLYAQGASLLVAAEAVGCGSGDCATDPTFRSHLLLHRQGDAWMPARVLGARQCAVPDDPIACQADLDLFTVADVAMTNGHTLAVVGGDLSYEAGLPRQLMLSYVVQLSPIK